MTAPHDELRRLLALPYSRANRGRLADAAVAALPSLLDECAALTAERDALRATLERIASRDEGAEVNGSFDEPNAARLARTALAAGPAGPTKDGG